MEPIGAKCMNKIFDFLNYDSLYKRCIMASIAHAIMVGRYNLLASEQSWDGYNYNFQNMEGIRGVISFYKGIYVCVTQNNVEYAKYNEFHTSKLFYGAEEKIIKLAKDEALQYMLVDYNGNSIPFISTAFWGDRNSSFSNQSEAELIEISQKLIMPFLYSESDAKKFWRDYYEMSAEQYKMMEDIFEKRTKTRGIFNLTLNEKTKLEKWFGDISECVESFEELKIMV